MAGHAEGAPGTLAMATTPRAFDVPAEHYDRFVGRFTATLAPALVDYAGIRTGMRALDVGCGPGGLTSVLVQRIGAGSVAAIDPAVQFVFACQERHAGTDVRQGYAEHLPWPDHSFDAAIACLVIGFMSDPNAGLREMARVVRPGGTVAACMWDLAGDRMTMLETFWTAARTVAPNVPGERRLPGGTDGDIAEHMRSAGLLDVVAGALPARAHYTDFDDFWEPFTHGVGPAGQYLAAQSHQQQTRIRDACQAALPNGAFDLHARAWCARGKVAPPRPEPPPGTSHVLEGQMEQS